MFIDDLKTQKDVLQDDFENYANAHATKNERKLIVMAGGLCWRCATYTFYVKGR